MSRKRRGCRTPNLAVSLPQVSFDSDVGAEREGADFLQRRELEVRRDGEGDPCFAGKFRRVEEEKFVDDSCGEGGAIERRPGFEKDAEDFAAAKLNENGVQADSTAARTHPDDFCACLLKSACFLRTRGLASENQQVVVGSSDESRFQREGKLAVEDHAPEQPPSGKAAAIRQKGIIAFDRADAGEKRIRRVAHAVNFRAGFFRANPICALASMRLFARLTGLARQDKLAIER